MVHSFIQTSSFGDSLIPSINRLSFLEYVCKAKILNISLLTKIHSILEFGNKLENIFVYTCVGCPVF